MSCACERALRSMLAPHPGENRRQRRPELVRDDRQELVFGAVPRLGLVARALELGVATLDLRQHVVERRDEEPDLVLGARLGTNRIVLRVRDDARGVDEVEDRCGDDPLHL